MTPEEAIEQIGLCPNEAERVLLAHVRRLQESLRAAAGGCRMLSEGDMCDCGLCKRDHTIGVLVEKTGYLEREVKRLRELCESLVGEEKLYQDGQYETEMQRLRTELADAKHGIELADSELAGARREITRMLEATTLNQELHAEKARRRDCIDDDTSREILRLREALTPSADTKAAYIGEFSQPSEFEGFDDVTITWVVTKEIMAAIRARAAEKGGVPCK